MLKVRNTPLCVDIVFVFWSWRLKQDWGVDILVTSLSGVFLWQTCSEVGGQNVFTIPGLSSDIFFDGMDEDGCLYQVLWSSRGFLQAWLLVASAVSMLSCIGGTIAEHAVGFVGQSHMGTWLCIVVGRCRCRSFLWEWVLSYTQPCVLVADAFYSMS